MDRDEILQRTQRVFRDVFDNEAMVIADSTTARDVEDWDSLTHINLVAAIEKEFGIRFALGELQGLQNVGEMVGLIVAKRGS